MKSLPSVLRLAVLSLAACAHFQPRTLSPNAGADSFAGRSLADAGLKAFLADHHAGRAWTSDKLALSAVYFHGDVRVAQAQVKEASAGIATASQRPNPVLSFSPAYDSTSKGISPWIITPTLDIPIETAGKRGKRILIARAEVESAKLKLATAGWEARNKVRKAMLDVYAGRETALLLKAEIALHDEALKKLDAQVKAGEAPAFELTTARLSLNRSKLALHDAEKKSATGLAQLASAVGVPSSALSAVTLDFTAFESLPAEPGHAARRRALTHRSDLLAALADYKAAEAALRLEIAKQYPDIHLGPGYELDQTDNKWHLGFSIDLPILHQNQGPISQAEAKRKTAAVKFETKQSAIFGEIETALAAYRAAQAKVATAAKLADEAAHASDTTKRMVEAGELGPLDLVRRRIEASASILSHLESRLQAEEAIGQLEAALQLPLRSVK